MTSFDDREQAFEKKFALDAETAFKVTARRNRMVGEWAAGLLGLTGEAAAEYARSVVMSDLEEPGDEDIVRKLVADLAGTGTEEDAIRARLAAAEPLARAEVLAG